MFSIIKDKQINIDNFTELIDEQSWEEFMPKGVSKKVFENFAYRINVIPKIDLEKKEIQFNIEGLSAPRLDISKAGNAVYEYKLFEFKNVVYQLKLMKYAKGKIILKFKVSPKEIKLTLNPDKKFINVFTEGN